VYNLVMAFDSEAWTGRRYAISKDRFGEYTAEALKSRFQPLTAEAVEELSSLPTLFAYELQRELPARLGQVTRVRYSSRNEMRFEFSLFDEVEPISPEQLEDFAWDLDIGKWELNRTHWAIKDVNLFSVLKETGLVSERVLKDLPILIGKSASHAEEAVRVSPKVFRAPDQERDEKLVAVMMPFSAEFEEVANAIQDACAEAGLTCARVDDAWQETTVIQDIFSLIYRSEIVIADITGKNPNVLYEVGIAHTLGRDVVPISQTVSELPFDLAHHRVLKYLPNSEGLSEMKVKLARRLGYLAG